MLSTLPRLGSTLLTLFLATVSPLAAVEVFIDSPGPGEVVAGLFEISGTTDDLAPGGRVAVSIDGGPFTFAVGQEAWTFDWDTRSVADGTHQIVARARDCPSCPAAVASVRVEVVNGGGPIVAFTSPEDGAVVADTLVVVGSSSGATEVTLAVDGGAFRVANGLDPWSVVFEPGALDPGDHDLLARAVDGEGGESFASLSITVDQPPPGLHEFFYSSSVDGEPLGGVYYLPQGYDPDAGPVGLVMHLHGGGGTGSISAEMQLALDEKGWIGISPDGRAWGLHDPADPESCPWETSAAYVDHPDPAVGPGEQDTLDAIDWAASTFDIDPDRVYLQGFSMGGRGTYIIGLKNPDRFAAIAPMGPAIDMYEVFVRRPNPAACKEGMVGGQPGDSARVDTFYSITSGRFLVENAYNLPVFHGHGTEDTVASNTLANAPFLHGWHITDDNSWSDCHADLCFGHTPTLAELRALHATDPEAYDWAFYFSPVGHSTDPAWLHGGAPRAGDFGVGNPEAPGELLGIYDFFAARTRQRQPATVVYKTYTDQHRRAFWAEIDITTPWLNLPGAIRAQRDAGSNRLGIELVRVATATIDVAAAGLVLSPGQQLLVDLAPLVEPAYDPALAAPGEALSPVLVLRGIDLAAARRVRVLRDGEPLATELVAWSADELSIGPLDLGEATVLDIRVLGPGAVFFDGFEAGDTAAWSELSDD